MIQKIHSLIRRKFPVSVFSRIHALSSGHTIHYLCFVENVAFLEKKNVGEEEEAKTE